MMKRSISAIAALAATAAFFAGAPASAANILLDSSFSDSTFPDVSAAWTVTDDYMAVSGCGERGAQIQNSAFANNPGGDAGTNSGVWFRPFANLLTGCAAVDVDASVSQTVAVVGGSAYSAEGAFKIEANFTADSFVFEVVYLNAAMSFLSSSALDLLAAVPNDGDWYDRSFMSVAPLDAAFAMVIVAMTGGTGANANPQSAFADDLMLIGDAPPSEVPVPGAIVLFLTGLAGLQFVRRANNGMHS